MISPKIPPQIESCFGQQPIDQRSLGSGQLSVNSELGVLAWCRV